MAISFAKEPGTISVVKIHALIVHAVLVKRNSICQIVFGRLKGALGLQLIPMLLKSIFRDALAKGLVFELILKLDDLGGRRPVFGILLKALVDQLMNNRVPS